MLILGFVRNSWPSAGMLKLIETVLVVVPSSAVIKIVVVPGILVASVIAIVAFALLGVAAIVGTTVVPPAKNIS